MRLTKFYDCRTQVLHERDVQQSVLYKFGRDREVKLNRKN